MGGTDSIVHPTILHLRESDGRDVSPRQAFAGPKTSRISA